MNGVRILLRIIVSLLGMLLITCNGQPDTLLHNYQRVKGNDGWGRTDTVCIPLSAVKQTASYVLNVGVRRMPDYPYQGLTVVVQAQLQNPGVLLTDTVRLLTNDTVTARPLGQGNAMPTVEQSAVHLHLYRGQYGTLRIYHLMHHDPLPAITHVGVRVSVKE